MAEILSTVSPLGDQGTPANGGSRWATIAAAESGDQGDLTTGANVGGEPSTYVLEGYGTIDGTSVWADWVVSATFYQTLKAASGEEYNYLTDTGFKLTGTLSNTIDIEQPFYKIYDTGVYGSASTAIRFTVSAVETELYRTTIVSDSTYSLDTARRSYPNIIENCLVINTASGAANRIDPRNTSDQSKRINNTDFIANTGNALLLTTTGALTIAIQNSSFASNGLAIEPSSSTFAGTYTNNATSDASFPWVDTNGQVLVSLADATDFVEPSTGDYQVQPTGKLENTGINLTGTFSDDILGLPRPPTGAWEIGCYEIQGAPAGAVLDTPTVTAITQTTATIGCTTDTAGGTLYWTVTESATATAADIKAGTGVDSGNFVPGGTGPQTVGATGLTADTAYYHHWVQVT